MSWIPFACVGLALAVFIGLAYWRGWRWAGFAEAPSKKVDGTNVLPAKTLWDWLQLLVIPLALAGLAFLINNSQSNREQQREDQRQGVQRATALDAAREEALRAYLSQMSGLMLDRKLRSQPVRDVQPVSEVQAVARTLTLTVLRRVEGERKGLVVRFLWEAGLVALPFPRVDVQGADLRSANLAGAFLDRAALDLVNLQRADLRRAFLTTATLGGAKLQRADLWRAVLEQAYLQRADLRRANLREAVLTTADLGGAKLQRADLRRASLGRADLRGSHLRHADLRRADIRGADLRQTDLQQADLSDARYDSRTRWPPRFDPVAAGARNSP